MATASTYPMPTLPPKRLKHSQIIETCLSEKDNMYTEPSGNIDNDGTSDNEDDDDNNDGTIEEEDDDDDNNGSSDEEDDDDNDDGTSDDEEDDDCDDDYGKCEVDENPYDIEREQVASLLTTILWKQNVPHLVAQILDLAEFWRPYYVSRNLMRRQQASLRVYSRNGDMTESRRPLVTLGPIPESVQQRGLVRRLTIRILGRSQGWCSEPDSGSWSWYCIARARAHGLNEKSKPRMLWEKRLMLVKNEILAKNYKRHEVTIDHTDDSELGGWLRTLMPGDVIGVWARAQYPGWANITADADVEMEYSAT